MEKFKKAIRPIYVEYEVRINHLMKLRYDLQTINRPTYYQYSGKLTNWKNRRVLAYMESLSWEEQITFATWSSEYCYLRFFLDPEQQSACILLGAKLRSFEENKTLEDLTAIYIPSN